ncbi:MAG: heme exporter protein CcmD [Pseudomonadota bacterium]
MVMASLVEWAAMGGHGRFVWSAWGVTAVFMVGLALHARLERRQLLRQLKRQARRQPPPPPGGPSHDPDA